MTYPSDPGDAPNARDDSGAGATPPQPSDEVSTTAGETTPGAGDPTVHIDLPGADPSAAPKETATDAGYDGWSSVPDADQPSTTPYPEAPHAAPTTQYPTYGQGTSYPQQGQTPDAYGDSQAPYGQAPYGQAAPYGEAPYGQTAYGQSSYGHYQFGQDPSGQSSYGPPAYGQPVYGQSPYGQPGYGYGYSAPTNSSTAIASLVLSIGAFPALFFCFFLAPVFSVISVVLGFVAKREIANSGGMKQGGGIALAGIIIGGIGIVICILFAVLFGVAIWADS